MAKILGISGSLRRGSFNAALLRAAVELAPEGTAIDVGTIRGIPLYDADLEASDGIPGPVTRLKEQIAACDGLLLVTPEYNNSIPGVFKNALDWCTRPPSDIPRVFKGRPVAILGASPSRFGTLLSQTAWLPIFRTLDMRPWFGVKVYVSEANRAFDSTTGRLIDEGVRDRLATFIAEYAKHLDAMAAGR